MSLEHLTVSERKDTKSYEMSKGHRNQFEEIFTGQIQDILSNKMITTTNKKGIHESTETLFKNESITGRRGSFLFF